MILLGLLAIPIIMGLIGLLFSKGRVTVKEFLCHEAIMVALVIAGYYIARAGQISDTEIWNGVVASKKHDDRESCCHSYRCNCRKCGCDKNGNNCSECCDTCYEHSHDQGWYAYSSNGETVYSDRCNPPYASEPLRWTRIDIGEPTAVEHSYDNYIKGNPDSIMRRQGLAERYADLIPDYPRVYDLYRANRFLAVGTSVRDQATLNLRLSEINARLGSPRQVNLIVIVVGTADQIYAEALKEAWLGGKKNDLVTVIGVNPDNPGEISWVSVMSWTRNEDIKLSIRDRIMDLKSLDGDRVLDIIEQETATKFVRRPMADFEYLASTIEPPTWACWLLFALGVIISVGLQVYFWKCDPFGDERRRHFSLRHGMNPFRTRRR
jgi:hypothetical protein